MIMITAQKMKFSSNDLFRKWDRIRRKPRIWSQLLKKSLIKNFIFCVVDNENEYENKDDTDDDDDDDDINVEDDDTDHDPTIMLFQMIHFGELLF